MSSWLFSGHGAVAKRLIDRVVSNMVRLRICRTPLSAHADTLTMTNPFHVAQFAKYFKAGQSQVTRRATAFGIA
jgi:hypothetical protein